MNEAFWTGFVNELDKLGMAQAALLAAPYVAEGVKGVGSGVTDAAKSLLKDKPLPKNGLPKPPGARPTG